MTRTKTVNRRGRRLRSFVLWWILAFLIGGIAARGWYELKSDEKPHQDVAQANTSRSEQKYLYRSPFTLNAVTEVAVDTNSDGLFEEISVGIREGTINQFIGFAKQIEDSKFRALLGPRDARTMLSISEADKLKATLTFRSNQIPDQWFRIRLHEAGSGEEHTMSVELIEGKQTIQSLDDVSLASIK